MAQSIEIQGMAWDIRANPFVGNSGERQRRREQRLRQLIAALQAGALDAARVSFSALVSHDEEMAHNTHLTHVGAALQSSNLTVAWRLAQPLRARYPGAFHNPVPAKPPATTPAPKQPLRAWVDGMAGRMFDYSA
ncbi:MAG: hypothetical protein EBT37_09510 [Betaproteobacteria bacterium]|jgi:hypothetical protein|nr:hypothetical protein [Betaproteobacteria bacterium]